MKSPAHPPGWSSSPENLLRMWLISLQFWLQPPQEGGAGGDEEDGRTLHSSSSSSVPGVVALGGV